ncbi:PAS domain-containing protein [Candidatus Omnitrophota bacterium]
MSLNVCQLRIPGQVASIIVKGVTATATEEELILLAIEDITERKNLQKELEESEERYHRAFETSHNVLLLIHKIEATVLNANEIAQKLLGYSKEEFLKKKLWDLGVIKNEKAFREMMFRLEREGVIHYKDTPIKTKKGPALNSEVFLVNKAKVVQCNISDISERKKIQKELSEKMQDLERFSKFSVDRELKMEELEKKLKELEEKPKAG